MKKIVLRNVIFTGALCVVLLTIYFAQTAYAQYTKIRPISFEDKSIAAGKFETRGSYQIKGDKVVFDFELMNHYTETKKLQFGSGQQFELVITDEKGQEVYRYSDGKFFTQALLFKEIKPGQSIKWQDQWDMTNKEGKKLTSGKYKAEISIIVVPEDNEQKIDESQLKTVIDLSLTENPPKRLVPKKIKFVIPKRP